MSWDEINLDEEGSSAERGARPVSVSQAMARAKVALESLVLTLEGEVSELSDKAGYKAVYFTVKDEHASLPCMMWRNRYAASGLRLQLGAVVRLTGRFSLYAPKGRMNFEVFSLQLAGEGALRQKVAERARRLAEEGLLSDERKRAIPLYPETIGLVTSPRGAAVHDVLRTLRRRYPLARVLLAGVPVEGAGAPAALIEGLSIVAAAGAELILLVRGGGSFEDLMPFNDESLARAIAASPVPVVTGIGHEPDTSIADLVADLRASTPTAAAEAVSPLARNLSIGFDNAARRLATAVSGRIERSRNGVESLASRPVFADAQALFATDAQTLDLLGDALSRVLPQNLERDASQIELLRNRLSSITSSLCSEPRLKLSLLADRLGPSAQVEIDRHATELTQAERALRKEGARFGEAAAASVVLLASRLEDLSPLTVLSRGYAMARRPDGALIRSVREAPEGSSVELVVSDGALSCRVERSTPRSWTLKDQEDR